MMNCKHCGDPLYEPPKTMADGSLFWVHQARGDGSPGLHRCQHTVSYGHNAEPVGQPCRAEQPNPCLGSGV